MRQSPTPQRRGGDRGATAVEYGLMLGLIAAVLLGGVLLLGEQVQWIFEDYVAAWLAGM